MTLRLIAARGKVLVGGGVLPIDLDVAAGVDRDRRPVIGGGMQLFVTDWMTAGVGVRAAGGDSAVGLTLSLLMPLTPRRSCRCR